MKSLIQGHMKVNIRGILYLSKNFNTLSLMGKLHEKC